MALMYKYLPVEYQYKFETCVLNIKNKPGLSLIIAAACHEQLQMLTDYVNNTIDNNRDLTVLHVMLDTFIALTYQQWGVSNGFLQNWWTILLAMFAEQFYSWTRRAIKNNFQFNRGPSRLYNIRLISKGGDLS